MDPITTAILAVLPALAVESVNPKSRTLTKA